MWEWCDDWYAPDYYESSPRENPMGPRTGRAHVALGGSWDSPPTVLSASCRNWGYVGYREGELQIPVRRRSPTATLTERSGRAIVGRRWLLDGSRSLLETERHAELQVGELETGDRRRDARLATLHCRTAAQQSCGATSTAVQSVDSRTRVPLDLMTRLAPRPVGQKTLVSKMNAATSPSAPGDASRSGDPLQSSLPRSLAFAGMATSSASGRSTMMPSPQLLVGRSSAWIVRGDQSGVGRRRGSLDPPAVPTDPEVVRGAEGQIPRMATAAILLL